MFFFKVINDIIQKITVITRSYHAIPSKFVLGTMSIEARELNSKNLDRGLLENSNIYSTPDKISTVVIKVSRNTLSYLPPSCHA